VTADQIIEDYYAFACGAQEFYGDAADVAGTSCDENCHLASFVAGFFGTIDSMRLRITLLRGV
jgi:hypothetical protein